MVKRGMKPEKAIEIWGETGKLKNIRAKKGLSQNDLSMLSGVPKTTIQCYERGTRFIDGARLNVLCDLAISLNCKIEDLLEDKSLIQKFKKVK